MDKKIFDEAVERLTDSGLSYEQKKDLNTVIVFARVEIYKSDRFAEEGINSNRSILSDH